VAARNGYQDPHWLTYRQAAENGWQVRRGEKGTHIVYWQLDETRQKAHNSEPAAGSNPAQERRAGPIRRVCTVFNAQQIDGIPVHQRKQPNEWEVVKGGEQILGNSGVEISHDQRDRAFYNRATDAIHLPPKHAFPDPAAYYGIALHEAAHASGHPTRLNRQTLNERYRFGDPNYAREELRAELASLFLAAERGIPHNPEQHGAYVGSWVAALRNDKHEIFRAARDAQQAADFLLALERERSVDKALQSVNRTRGTSQASEETQLRRETSEHVAAFEAGSGTVGIVEKETATEDRKPAVAGRARTPDRLSPAGLEAETILDGEVNGRRRGRRQHGWATGFATGS
jgi:antirestriction protein ArdC